MGLAITIQVPINGQHFQYPMPALIHAIQIQNLSQSNLNIKNLTGTDVITIPAGLTQNVNVTTGAAQIEVWTDTATTGEAWLYLYDSINDLSGNPNVGAQQVSITNATLTVNGTVTATISGNVSLAPGTTVNIGNTVTVTGNVTVGNTVTVTGTMNVGSITNTVTVTGNVQDLIVENNTTTLAGVLANTVVPLTLTNNIIVSTTISKAITSFSLMLIAPEGFLDLWYTASGQDEYLVRAFPFSSLANNTWQPVEKIFLAPIPAGAVLKARMGQSIGGSSAVLKY